MPLARVISFAAEADGIGAVLRNREDIRQRLTEASSTAKRLADANFIAMGEALRERVRAAA